MTLEQFDTETILQEATDVLLIARETYPKLGKLDQRSLNDSLSKGTTIVLPFYILKYTFENKFFKMLTPDYFSRKQLTQIKMAPLQYDFSNLGKSHNINILNTLAQCIKDKSITSEEIQQILKQVQKERINNYSQIVKALKSEKIEQRRRENCNKQFAKQVCCDIE